MPKIVKPKSVKKQTYPCYRCSGLGKIQAFGHVLGGVCFKCGGSGWQLSKPTKSLRWVVLDSAGLPVYNVNAKNDQVAIRTALGIFIRARASRNPEAIEFVSQHNMESPTAVPYEEYWTDERVDALQ